VTAINAIATADLDQLLEAAADQLDASGSLLLPRSDVQRILDKRIELEMDNPDVMEDLTFDQVVPFLVITTDLLNEATRLLEAGL
jgi:hypothetical protein